MKGPRKANVIETLPVVSGCIVGLKGNNQGRLRVVQDVYLLINFGESLPVE